jgi:uncharacterized membrane protein
MSALGRLRARSWQGLALLAGASLGAGAMFLADPERGHRRRALARDKLNGLLHRGQRNWDKGVRDLGNRVQGAAIELLSALLPEHIPDEVLADRIRASLGRLVSHPGAIRVNIQDGQAVLRGDVLEREVTCLMTRLSLMKGVRSVSSELNVHREAGDVPGLQGGRQVRPWEFELLRPRWAPATRLVVGGAGLSLALCGARRRGLLGAGLGLVGAGMVVRSLTNIGPLEGMGLCKQASGFSVQKTATIEAPVERVFELLVNPERLPRIMDHVQEVKKAGEHRYHWTVLGPAGVPLHWDSEVTHIVPNELLAWRSAPGALVQNAGTLHFEPTAEGGTRVRIHMRYNPPGGALANALAEMFGADPKTALDDDMVRLKSLMERGKTRAHHLRVKIEELEKK